MGDGDGEPPLLAVTLGHDLSGSEELEVGLRDVREDDRVALVLLALIDAPGRTSASQLQSNRPESASRRSNRRSSAAVAGSSPEVGSSRKKTCGLVKSSTAILARFRWPPEQVSRVHGAHAVDQAVMRLGGQRPAPAGESFEHDDLPQRPAPVEELRPEFAKPFEQLALASRSRQARAVDVVLDRESPRRAPTR